MPYLPMCQTELKERGWDSLDIILVSGDAYVDHPSFGAAIIGRALESAGFRVGIIAQPDWRRDADFLALGKPRLFFGVTAGNMDSMVNHYTAQKKLRHNDAYSPGGVSGLRPDRACLIYTNMLKRIFKGVPIVLGGIEASLRRIAHWDFWSETIKNSLLADTKADILVYGMAEDTIIRIAKQIKAGQSIRQLTSLPGTVVFDDPFDDYAHILPPASELADKKLYHQLYKDFYESFNTDTLYQLNGGRWIRHNPPAAPLDTPKLDSYYELPYENSPHPKYKGHTIPAWEQIKDSITSHRGCYGGCNFCAIGLHQGRSIQSRSPSSIIKEAKALSARKDSFHGSISDIGGPTANMYMSRCKLGFPSTCKRLSCLYPAVCPNLVADHAAQIKLLQEIEQLPGVKHIFISSGIRFDLAIQDSRYICTVAQKYTGGRLKLAPEHVAKPVLDLMGKPSIRSYEDFCDVFFKQTKELGIKRQIIPYIIIGHPGTTMEHARELADWLRRNHIRIEQVQEFTPTPMTISTTMYYTGLDFNTGKPIFVPKGREIREQKRMAMWWIEKEEKTLKRSHRAPQSKMKPRSSGR